MQEHPRDRVGEGLRPILPRLWRFALALSGDPKRADDLVRAACQRALELAFEVRDGPGLQAWAFAILLSLWHGQEPLDDDTPSVSLDPALLDQDSLAYTDFGLPADMAVTAKQVLAALRGLPASQRATVGLVYMEGFTYHEAADLLEVPISTVMTRLTAARKALAPLSLDDSGAETADPGGLT